MKNYLFEDDNGEEFIVNAYDFIEAFEIVESNFINPHYICELSDFEAEMSGIDTY